MISLNWLNWKKDVASLMQRYEELPRHIAKKHILAAMKRAVVKSRGVQTLKSVTPKGKARFVKAKTVRGERGRFAAGSGKMTRVPPGALRKAVTVKAKYYGKNSSGFAFAALGYKYGAESRKALWLEFGTSRIRPMQMVRRAHMRIASTVRSALCGELLAALDKAVKELGGGKNPTKTF
jgi:hypothetical protein